RCATSSEKCCTVLHGHKAVASLSLLPRTWRVSAVSRGPLLRLHRRNSRCPTMAPGSAPPAAACPGKQREVPLGCSDWLSSESMTDEEPLLILRERDEERESTSVEFGITRHERPFAATVRHYLPDHPRSSFRVCIEVTA